MRQREEIQTMLRRATSNTDAVGGLNHTRGFKWSEVESGRLGFPFSSGTLPFEVES
jgi:hypothetical protein